MDIVVRLIEHLLNTPHSIDTVDSIVEQLKITRDRLLQLLRDERCLDFFQLLDPFTDRQQSSEKVALTLDLFCCTHYANTCKNVSCPFLHLCPYNVRPMHTRCTNKTCQFDHDILKSVHNRKIIDARHLDFIPAIVLRDIIRASADPNRSLWVCTEYGKKKGCMKKTNCDKLHYCYYALIDSCTKPHCSHVINDACLAYFRHKELNDQEHETILNAFRKVLRQRKPDYVNFNNIIQHSSSASASPKISNSVDHQRKSSINRQHRNSPSSRRSTSTIYDDALTSKVDLPPPLPDDEKDVFLIDHFDEREYKLTERFLSDELRRPVRLLSCKQISSPAKTIQNSNSKPIYYYYPIENPSDIFRLLRWQNEDNQFQDSLIAYANAHDAHDKAKQNLQTNQYCLLRLHLLQSNIINENLLANNRLKLNNPLTMQFDRLWTYVYNFQ